MIDDFFDLGWEAMALLGSLTEELAEEKVERLKRKQEMEHEVACPACTHPLLQEGSDGEWDVQADFRGKLKYLDERGDEIWQDHSHVVIAVLENEPGKLN